MAAISSCPSFGPWATMPLTLTAPLSLLHGESCICTRANIRHPFSAQIHSHLFTFYSHVVRVCVLLFIVDGSAAAAGTLPRYRYRFLYFA